MFSIEEKRNIADLVQAVLKATRNRELPDGQIEFLLHVDGEKPHSWANIRNNNSLHMGEEPPIELIRNTTVPW